MPSQTILICKRVSILVVILAETVGRRILEVAQVDSTQMIKNCETALLFRVMKSLDMFSFFRDVTDAVKETNAGLGD